MSHRLSALIMISSLASACAAEPGASICGLDDETIVLLPESASGIPTNAVIRALSGGNADDLHVEISRVEAERRLGGRETHFVTGLGDLLEFIPDRLLDPGTRYVAEVIDETGNRRAGVEFRTAADPESDLPATGSGAVTVTPIAGADRTCCSGSGACADGSLIRVPALAQGSFAPQLTLLAVDAHFNDECGAQTTPLTLVPVIWDGSADFVEAETNHVFEGCFSVTVVSQTLRESLPAPAQCTDGTLFVPLPPTAACAPEPPPKRSGCGAGGQGQPPPIAIISLLLILLAASAARRRLS